MSHAMSQLGLAGNDQMYRNFLQGGWISVFKRVDAWKNRFSGLANE